MKLPEPMFNHILVKPDTTPSHTPGGIKLPDNCVKKLAHGTVVAVGKGKMLPPEMLAQLGPSMMVTDATTRFPMTLKTGDQVYFGEYVGQSIKVNGEDFIVLTEDEILAFDRP